MQVSQLHSNIINEQQRSVFKMLLLLTACGGVFFFAMNMHRGLMTLGLTELVMSVVSLLLYIKIKKLKNYRTFAKFALCYLLLFFSLMLFAMWEKSASITVFVWVFLVPVLSYLLIGRKLGTYITILFSSLAFLIYIVNFRNDPTLVHFIAFANIVLCFITIWFVAQAYEHASTGVKDRLALMSLQDQLTGLYNRNALPLFFEQHPPSNTLTMVILDIDYFKQINDSYGHPVGDKALQVVSQELSDAFDVYGKVMRIGGEEFCVLLPDMSVTESVAMTQDFLTKRANNPFSFDGMPSFQLTLSAGIAQYPSERDDFEALHKLTDKRLYQAKNSGRNRLIAPV